jgi:hypothetical protein
VDFHIDRKLRLHTEPKYKNLYSWAINEIDAEGRQIGDHDWIPWRWTFVFTGISCELTDSINIRSKLQSEDETSPAPIEITERQAIRVQLRPDDPRNDGAYLRQPTFSMLGTARAVKNFELEIYPGVGPNDQESCTAWGTVSYTSEVDFRDETEEDYIVFYLSVKAETFSRYAAKITSGSVSDIVFSVKSVAGFYSEWSPSISTHSVKVLTAGGEQEITLPTGTQFAPPRLGDVGGAALLINRRLEFGMRAPDPESLDETADLEETAMVPETRAPATADPRTLIMLGSLRRAAWYVVFVPALILVAVLWKGQPPRANPRRMDLIRWPAGWRTRSGLQSGRRHQTATRPRRRIDASGPLAPLPVRSRNHLKIGGGGGSGRRSAAYGVAHPLVLHWH